MMSLERHLMEKELSKFRYFDESTVSAVKEFQVDHSIEATGVIDNKTASELTLALREKIRDKQYDTQLQKAIGMLQQ